MPYQPTRPPARGVDYVILAAVMVATFAALWAGIPSFFRAIAWAGDVATRQGWL